MQKTALKTLLVALFICCRFISFAKTTRLETFILREQSRHAFYDVNGLWKTDDEYSKSSTTAYVNDCQLLKIDANMLASLMEQKKEGIVLQVPDGKGGSIELVLARFDPFSDGFEVRTTANGISTKYDYKPGIYYSGIVAGHPGSFAAFSLFDHEVYGTFSTHEEGNFALVPNSLQPKENNEHYIIYKDSDLKNPKGLTCGADELPDLKPFQPELNAAAKNALNNCKDVEIYFQGDYASYLTFNSNVTTFVNFITGVYNVCMNLYRNEGIYTSIKYIDINTTTDAYQALAQGSSNFLKKFGELTQNNMHGADLAMLLSTRYNSGMGGVAWRDVLCDGYTNGGGQHYGPYAFSNIDANSTPAFPNYNWNVNMITHEFGHNIASPHTHNCNWTGGAIDGCYTLEGSCSMPSPQYPAAGGTIMSYCHLVSGVGVKFVNGFGQQPGDLIRSSVNAASCATLYLQKKPIYGVLPTSFIANRECTDDNNITYYWFDYNNGNEADDRVVLMMNKGSNNIGNLDDANFEIRTTTVSGFGNGSAFQATLPGGTPHATNETYTFRQFWGIKPTTQPTSAVEVIVPFSYKDTVDMSGSINQFTFPRIYFYTVKNYNNHNPVNGFSGITGTDMTVYPLGSNASTSQWSIETGDSAYYAHYKTTQLWSVSAFSNKINNLGIGEVLSESIRIYPNPAKSEWNIETPAGSEPLNFMLYAADGRVVIGQKLNAGTNNAVSAVSLASGLYFFRINNGKDVYTGTLQKQ